MRHSQVKTAVVTAGHSYDVVNFHHLFRRLEGIDPYIQHMDDFASSPESVRDSYAAVVFYIMLTDTPRDDGLPWYAGKPKTSLEHLGAAGRGIVVLHHALLAYPGWGPWNEIVGVQDRSFGYHLDQTVRVRPSDCGHAITRDLAEWDMPDETYTMGDPGPDSRVLLTVDHPLSMKAIGWTRQYRSSRVFCFQSGHDDRTWQNERFREVLRRGILWSAERT